MSIKLIQEKLNSYNCESVQDPGVLKVKYHETGVVLRT